ncbi:MAG: hypothetical protein CMH57_00700 [Myxococcales bacterium]|nr:hypothetical protein [Myxococcales bacterium]
MQQPRDPRPIFLCVAISIALAACGGDSGDSGVADTDLQDTAADGEAADGEAANDAALDTATADSTPPDDAQPDTHTEDTESTDSESTDSESTDTESTDSEIADTAPDDTEVTDTEVTDTESTDTTPEDTESTDTEIADSGSGDTAPTDTTEDTSPEDTAPLDTAPEDTTPEDTEVADSGSGDTADAPPDTPALFDMEMIRDPVGLDCIWGNRRTEALEGGGEVVLWNVSYRSWEWRDGVLTPILIRGYAALPDALQGAPAPGVVWSHGLSGEASATETRELAGRLDALVLSYTGPGEGTQPSNSSEGLAASEDGHGRLFDTTPEVRGSWMWGHSAAAMRALTCLEGRPEVDSARLGMAGYSLGGLASLIVAAEDDRLDAAVVISSATHWDEAVAPDNAWQRQLLTEAGLTTESERWRRFVDTYAGPQVSQRVTIPVLLASGSSDGFFPVDALSATLADLSGDSRLALVGNLDHGCFLFGIPESTDVLAARSALRIDGGQRMWFRRAFNAEPHVEDLPAAPTVELTSPSGDALQVTAQVDESSSALAVTQVLVWWSADDALTWSQAPLTRADGAWSGELDLNGAPLLYVEALYQFGQDTFAIASAPVLPEAFVARVRNVQTCQP